ncbi:hypothetical protein CPT_Sansa28 [Caulobacter phage Sansa]|uniref:Uncharacterized protein n=1 Tax=Caulobacter phage Sansa TaxID=1675600 RepID=A0A0K1LLQ2_9CAUD|nr:hypothetical protein HOR07_gp028 [Caulobacter phage Sansa]AKU43432.1 hypothetical protein CPT_Sansa28 [Caulobacter phage Sansa]
MDAISRSATLIANKAFTFAGRSYEPGDRFNWRRLSFSSRRKVNVMLGPVRKLVELSPDTMASALKRRDKGSRPPRGFTLAGLLALNLVTEEQVKRFGWVQDQETGDDDETGSDSTWQAPEGSVQEGALWVIPVKTRGGPARFDIVDGEGERVLTGGTIAGKDKAIAKAQELNQQAAQHQGIDQHASAVDTQVTFADYPIDEELWTPEQMQAFNDWFDALDDSQEVAIANPAAVMLFNKRKREAARAAQEAAQTPPAGEGSQDQQNPPIVPPEQQESGDGGELRSQPDQ